MDETDEPSSRLRPVECQWITAGASGLDTNASSLHQNDSAEKLNYSGVTQQRKMQYIRI